MTALFVILIWVVYVTTIIRRGGRVVTVPDC